jgi:hypothetical protein
MRRLCFRRQRVNSERHQLAAAQPAPVFLSQLPKPRVIRRRCPPVAGADYGRDTRRVRDCRSEESPFDQPAALQKWGRGLFPKHPCRNASAKTTVPLRRGEIDRLSGESRIIEGRAVREPVAKASSGRAAGQAFWGRYECAKSQGCPRPSRDSVCRDVSRIGRRDFRLRTG